MIEKITESDIPELVEMSRQAHAESKYSHYPFCPDTVKETFLEHLRPPMLAVKCTGANGINGFFLAAPWGMIFTKQLVARETSFWVRPEARGTRCAMLLTWTFLDWAAEHNLPAVTTIHFSQDNEKTYRFIERMGMTEIGRMFGKDI